MSVLRVRSALSMPLPPRPPSPPSGPPRGTYFSRRNETAPSPPSPAITSINASSKNFTGHRAPPAGETAQSVRYRRHGDGLPTPFPMPNQAASRDQNGRVAPTARYTNALATAHRGP